METEVTITRYNVTALIGWAGLILGLIGATLQYVYPSLPGFWFLAIGMIGGGLTVTFAGPLKSTVRHRVQLQALPHDMADK